MTAAGAMADPQDMLAHAALQKVAAFAGRAVSSSPGVPGVASPSYHGVESSTYAIALDDEPPDFFLKVATSEIRWLIDVPAAFDAATKVAALGLGPQPVFLAEAQGAILFHHLGPQWRAARIDDLRQPDRMAAVIAAHRRIAQGPDFLRTWNVFDGIAELWAHLGEADPALPPDAWYLKHHTDAIRDAVIAAGVDSRPAHADPHASNILFGPGNALALVDFDMAANVDPYYQLGALLNEAYPFDSEMQPAIEIFEGHFRQEALQRCLAYAAADDFYWGLRSLVLDRVSPRRGLEFRKYAAWRLLRCRMRVMRPGFEETLRAL
jgi:Ser/Thr protein kinase RdoA (MazF antagonist)